MEHHPKCVFFSFTQIGFWVGLRRGLRGMVSVMLMSLKLYSVGEERHLEGEKSCTPEDGMYGGPLPNLISLASCSFQIYNYKLRPLFN